MHSLIARPHRSTPRSISNKIAKTSRSSLEFLIVNSWIFQKGLKNYKLVISCELINIFELIIFCIIPWCSIEVCGNKKKCKKNRFSKSDVYETVIATCVVSARCILGSFSPTAERKPCLGPIRSSPVLDNSRGFSIIFFTHLDLYVCKFWSLQLS